MPITSATNPIPPAANVVSFKKGTLPIKSIAIESKKSIAAVEKLSFIIRPQINNIGIIKGTIPFSQSFNKSFFRTSKREI